MKNILMRIKKPKNFYIKTNLLENRYVTDGNIWTVDETIFNEETKLFLVVSVKTKVILGYIQGPNCQNEELIIELYKEILDEYDFPAGPAFVHSDMEEAYHSEGVRYFLMTRDIFISTTEGRKNQNQLSEGINSRIKYLVAEMLTNNTNAWGYRAFLKSLPPKLRSMKKVSEKCRSKEYRDFLFKSRLFKHQRKEVIQQAILKYNKSNFCKGITKQEAQYYDTFIETPTIENTQLVESNHIFAQKIKDENISSIQQVQSAIHDILKSSFGSEQKVAQILSLFFQRQDHTDELLKQGFVALSIQNADLLENNKELKEEIEAITKQNLEIQKKLDDILKEQALAQERREKRKNRKRLPKKEPLTEEIYEFIIERSKLIHRDTYQGARLRLALAILAVTGVRISELLPLKIKQIEKLLTHSWIEIDRVKRGPSNHKAFLTGKGRKIMKHRARDYEIIVFSKEDEDHVFTPQYSADPMNRQAFNTVVNDFLKDCSQQLPEKPNLKSHSFRIGFITKLWKDTHDIEFVRQAIGHAKIDTTSRYVQNLSEEERQQRMTNIQTTDDLFY